MGAEAVRVDPEGAAERAAEGVAERAAASCAEGEAALERGDLAAAERCFAALLAAAGPDRRAAAGEVGEVDDPVIAEAVARVTAEAGGPAQPGPVPPGGQGEGTSAASLAARARIGLGRVRLAQGDVGRAVVSFLEAWGREPEAPYWMGCALAHGGELPAAEACFTRCLEDAGPRAHVQRAFVRALSGRPDLALADLRAAERAGGLDDEGRWLAAALGQGARALALRLRKAALSALGGGAPDWTRAAALLAAAQERQDTLSEGEFAPLYATALVTGGRRAAALGLLGDATRRAPADHRVTHTLALAALNSPKDTARRGDETCVGAWGALLYDDAFWARARAGAARRYGTEVPQALVPAVRGALCDRLGRLLTERAGDGGRVPPDALLHREAEAARLLREAGGTGPLGGPLRIGALGGTREFGAYAAARASDTALLHAFSELGFARLKLDQGHPGDALAALVELRCPDCRARARGAVCEADCPRFEVLNPGYAGLPDRHDRLARDARHLALRARIALGHDALTAPRPDFATAAACWRRALVHSRELARYRHAQAEIAALALAAARDAHRAGNLARTVTTLETARSVIGANERPRIEGQLARALADRGIAEANREDGDQDGAAADLRRSVRLSPQLRRAQISLGIVLRNLALRRWASGSLSGARTALEEAVEALGAALVHFPDDPEFTEEHRRARSELDFVRDQFDESGR
ncbi:hypothetical protein [Streptomyces sp. G45]|uniref:hypothetical protein n=1 Tax=Streptomyces sp. G45 TaxID=3406627 RepID=UPI003C16E57A